MATPPSCPSPCSSAFRRSLFTLPTNASLSRRLSHRLPSHGSPSLPRLDVRSSLEPLGNENCNPSFCQLGPQNDGLWAPDFAMPSQLIDGGAVTLLQEWRAVRTRLCGAQSVQLGTEPAAAHWAHEIPSPEEGCVLLATEKLDSHPYLRKSVVLLLNSNKGSFCGVIVNRTLPFPAEEVTCIDTGVALGLGSCPTFLGGPLHTAASFHLLSPRFLQGFEPILPGIYMGSDQTALFSAWSSISRKRIAAEEVRVHIGQMEWDARILEAELVVFQWWKVVSCSSSLLHLQDVDCMWRKIHRLVSG